MAISPAKLLAEVGVRRNEVAARAALSRLQAPSANRFADGGIDPCGSRSTLAELKVRARESSVQNCSRGLLRPDSSIRGCGPGCARTASVPLTGRPGRLAI